MKSIEVFSGAGGLAFGLERSGFKHSAMIEFNKHACNTLRENFSPELVYEGDIRDYLFNQKDIDLVAGGPPCQPFSLGGKHQANLDYRDMFPCAIQGINDLNPKAFIFENVKGLLRPSFEKYFEYIILRLAFPAFKIKENQSWSEHLVKLNEIKRTTKPEYNIYYKLLNAADYGVPQTRERVFIVGIRTDIAQQWHFPKPTHSKKELIDQQVSGVYWLKRNIRPDTQYMASIGRLTDKNQQELFNSHPIQPWVTVRDALSHLPNPKTEHKIYDHIFKAGAKMYPGHTGSFIDYPAKTLKAGVHGVPGGENMIRFNDDTVRYFTTHEAKIIQGFPETFNITGAWSETMRQIGNAVPATLAEILGRQLKNLLEYSTSHSNAA
jgi:DNA (cytosine-5)-methyltransferase 1